ncbi:MAG: WGR domain-containing protein [Candidatus Thorarchaeota archaeon]
MGKIVSGGDRYEYKGKTKGGKPGHNFWLATQSGTEVIVHFGKVGTKGQTRVIDCKTAEMAKHYLTEKVQEKIKKGYRPVN